MKTSKFEVGVVRHTDTDTDSHDIHKDLRLKAVEIATRTSGMGERAVRLGLEAASLVNDDSHSRLSWYRRWRNALGIDFLDRNPVFPHISAGIGTAARTLALMEQRVAVGKVDPSWLSVGKGISGELAHTVLLGDWNAGRKIDEVFRELPDSEQLDATGFAVLNRYEDKSTAPRHYRLRVGGNVDGFPPYLGITRLRAAADLLSPRGDKYQIIKRASFVLNISDLDLGLREELGTALYRQSDGKLWDELGHKIVEPVLEIEDLRQHDTIRPGSVVYFALRRNNSDEQYTA